jgi:hypothetical protein
MRGSASSLDNQANAGDPVSVGLLQFEGCGSYPFFGRIVRGCRVPEEMGVDPGWGRPVVLLAAEKEEEVR